MSGIKKENIIEKKLFLKNPIFILVIIGTIGLAIRLNFFSYDVPITFDALTYYMHATDAKIFEGLPDTAMANNGWPLFLSLFFGISQSNNFLDYSAIQQLTTILLSTLTIIPVYLLCKKFVKTEYALLGSAIFVLEPRIIQNSTLGITEPLYIILISISLIFFLSNRFSLIIASFGFLAITSMVRSEGLFLLIPFSIFFFIKFKKEKKIIWKYIFAIAIFAIVLLPMSIYKMDVRDGDDAIFGRITTVLDNSESVENDISKEFSDYFSHSTIKFLQFVGWIHIPIFIIFVPIGIFLIFKNRDENSWTILVCIGTMLIPAFYGISTGPDTRYLYALYPMLCVISAIAIQNFLQKKKNSKKISIIIFGAVLILSISFLSIQMTDLDYQKDAYLVAQFVEENTSGINDYYPEIAFVKSAIVNSEAYPTLKKDVNFGKIKKFSIDSVSVEQFIEKNKNEGLSHLVIKNNEQNEFFRHIFYNEVEYSYLKKIFDSSNMDMKYNVKIFEIDYKKFYR